MTVEILLDHVISLFVVDYAVVDKCRVENVLDGREGKCTKATGIKVYGTRGIDTGINLLTSPDK